MRRIKVIGLCAAIISITASMLMAQSANSPSEQQVFVGSWVNANAGGTPARILINRAGDSWTIQAWGKCHPTNCDWGEVNFNLVGSSINDKSFHCGFAQWDQGFADRYMIVRHDGKQLTVETISIFNDASSRSNTRFLGVLERSATPPATRAGIPTISEDDDCAPYDPTALKIVNEGSHGWLLTDGHSRIALLDNTDDAEKALAVVRGHEAHCFIGRHNTQSNHNDYIVEYWTGDSGIETTIIGREDCIPYNPAKLHVVDEGSRGWLLTDGRSRMLMLADQKDAEKALALAKRNTRQCFIGRSNKRSNRKEYIVQYWK